jgi:hypothetical protein
VRGAVNVTMCCASPFTDKEPEGMTLIAFSEDALAYVREKKSPVFIDVPHKAGGCCFDLTAGN